jgi:hypothetical protein
MNEVTHPGKSPGAQYAEASGRGAGEIPDGEGAAYSDVLEMATRYRRRESRSIHPNERRFVHWARAEREFVYSELLHAHFGDRLAAVTALEVGAGSGDNLLYLHRTGIHWAHMSANELLSDRAESLRQNFPLVQVYGGSAFDLPETPTYDLVFVPLVFSCLLDDGFRRALAGRLWNLVRPGGLLLWYDLAVNNPRNRDVRGVPRPEVQQLFPHARISFRRVTLAPPVARRLWRFYHWINLPWLRTHLVAVAAKE